MSRRSVASDPVESVRDSLSRGVTGSLHVRDHRGEWVLYLMQGEILAAHGPADGQMVIRRLLNGGAISASQADQFVAELEAGEHLESLLIGRVPEDLFLDLLGQRFKQNLLEFISCTGDLTFQPLEAVFVENIQTGHDSFDLLDSLKRLRDRIAPLRNQADRLVVRPGAAAPSQLSHARLLDLCEPERLVQSLVTLSPFEDGVTLHTLAEMADQGVVQVFDIDDDQPEVSATASFLAGLESEVEPELEPELESELESEPGPASEPELLPEASHDEAALTDQVEGAAARALAELEELDELDVVDLVELDAEALQPISDIDARALATGGLEDALGHPTLEPLPLFGDEPDHPTEEAERPEVAAPPVEPGEQALPAGLFDDDDSDALETLSPGEELVPSDLGDDLVGAEPVDASAEEEQGAEEDADEEEPEDEEEDEEDEEEEDDPEIAHAIRRAQEIEARRAAAREELEVDEGGMVARPPGFDFDVEVPEDELAFFEDQDFERGGGKGQFVTKQQLLDRVDLSDEGMAAFQRAMQLPTDLGADDDGPIAMGEASEEEARDAVALNFTGPRLGDEDIRRKITVVNDVLAEIASALDAQNGKGSGRVSVQILVDGPPTRFAVLFRGVQVDETGRMDPERLLRNLRKRPQGEHRRLINDGLLDLIQRTLSTTVEELDDEMVDGMLERIAGYQQRLGI